MSKLTQILAERNVPQWVADLTVRDHAPLPDRDYLYAEIDGEHENTSEQPVAVWWRLGYWLDALPLGLVVAVSCVGAFEVLRWLWIGAAAVWRAL